MDSVILIGFFTILLAIFGVRIYFIYTIYRNSISPYLYSSFIEFAFRYLYKKNLTESSWIKQELGLHFLHFSSVQDEEGNSLFDTLTLLCSRGVFCFIITDDTESKVRANAKQFKLQLESKLNTTITLFFTSKSISHSKWIHYNQIIPTLEQQKIKLDSKQIEELALKIKQLIH